MRDFKQLVVWKKAFSLVKPAYTLCESLPDFEKFSLANQIRRSAVSVSLNLAEGSSRTTDKDKARFFEMALGSAYELENLMLVINDVHGSLSSEADLIREQLKVVQAMIYAFRSRLRDQ